MKKIIKVYIIQNVFKKYIFFINWLNSAHFGKTKNHNLTFTERFGIITFAITSFCPKNHKS